MVDLTDMTLFHNGFPHELFTHLRAEQPVLWQEFPKELPGTRDPGFWVLSRHADVQAANRDAEHFSAFDGPSLTGIPEIDQHGINRLVRWNVEIVFVNLFNRFRNDVAGRDEHRAEHTLFRLYAVR